MELYSSERTNTTHTHTETVLIILLQCDLCCEEKETRAGLRKKEPGRRRGGDWLGLTDKVRLTGRAGLKSYFRVTRWKNRQMKTLGQRPLEVSVPGKSQEEQGLCDQRRGST